MHGTARIPFPRDRIHPGEGSTVSQHRSRGRKQRSASFVEPSPGEHTRELLAGLGYGEKDIDALFEKRIVTAS